MKNQLETSAARHRALADVTRLKILDELAREELDSAQLAQVTGLHANTVRSHLEVLEGAGLVSRRPVPSGARGRPRIVYGRTGRGDGSSMLARILLARIARDKQPHAAAESAGRAWMDALREHRPANVEELVALFDEMGFAPEDAGGGCIRFHQCPFQAMLETEHAELACAVHLGMLRGAMARMGGADGVRLEPLVEPGTCVGRVAVEA